MKKNMGSVDRVIRIIIAIIIGILFQQGLIEGLPATILAVVAIIFLLTSIVSFCPLYRLLGINTCPLVKQ